MNPFLQFLNIALLNVENILPSEKDVGVYSISQYSPEQMVEELQKIELPMAICFDSRDKSSSVAREWLDQLESKLPEGIHFQRVMVLSKEESSDHFSDLMFNPEMEWIFTSDFQTPLAIQYLEIVRNGLKDLYLEN